MTNSGAEETKPSASVSKSVYDSRCNPQPPLAALDLPKVCSENSSARVLSAAWHLAVFSFFISRRYRLHQTAPAPDVSGLVARKNVQGIRVWIRDPPTFWFKTLAGEGRE